MDGAKRIGPQILANLFSIGRCAEKAKELATAERLWQLRVLI